MGTYWSGNKLKEHCQKLMQVRRRHEVVCACQLCGRDPLFPVGFEGKEWSLGNLQVVENVGRNGRELVALAFVLVFE